MLISKLSASQYENSALDDNEFAEFEEFDENEDAVRNSAGLNTKDSEKKLDPVMAGVSSEKVDDIEVAEVSEEDDDEQYEFVSKEGENEETYVIS